MHFDFEKLPSKWHRISEKLHEQLQAEAMQNQMSGGSYHVGRKAYTFLFCWLVQEGSQLRLERLASSSTGAMVASILASKHP